MRAGYSRFACFIPRSHFFFFHFTFDILTNLPHSAPTTPNTHPRADRMVRRHERGVPHPRGGQQLDGEGDDEDEDGGWGWEGVSAFPAFYLSSSRFLSSFWGFGFFLFFFFFSFSRPGGRGEGRACVCVCLAGGAAAQSVDTGAFLDARRCLAPYLSF
jgi:hypothetical protein